MKTLKRILALVACVLLLGTTVAAYNIPASTSEYYLDDANVMSSSLEQHIHDKNYALDQASKAYIEIVTVEYINGNISSYAYQLFNDWSLSDNAVLMVIATKEEDCWVTWGFGIDETDQNFAEDAGDILDKYFYDSFDAGDYETAIRQTYDALYNKLVKLYGDPTAVTPTPTPTPSKKTSSGTWVNALLFILLVWFIVWLVKRMSRPRRRTYTTYNAPYTVITSRKNYNRNRNRRYDDGPHGSQYGHDPHGYRPSSSYSSRPSSYGSYSSRPSSSSSYSSRPSSSSSYSSRPSSSSSYSSRPSSSSSSSSFSGRSSGGSSRGAGVGRRGK